VLRLSIRKEKRETEWVRADEYSFLQNGELMPTWFREPASPLLVGVRASTGYLLYTRLLTLTCGSTLFF
jgi:hypothetical protein